MKMSGLSTFTRCIWWLIICEFQLWCHQQPYIPFPSLFWHSKSIAPSGLLICSSTLTITRSLPTCTSVQLQKMPHTPVYLLLSPVSRNTDPRTLCAAHSIVSTGVTECRWGDRIIKPLCSVSQSDPELQATCCVNSPFYFCFDICIWSLPVFPGMNISLRYNRTHYRLIRLFWV